MKRAIKSRSGLAAVPLLSVLFLPGFVPNRFCQDWMTPAYSTYTSYSLDETYIYTSVTVDGTTNGTCPTQPAQLANECHNTHHTPQVYNLIGNVGGWETGSSVYWNSYLSMSNRQQIAATRGAEYTFSYSSEVICTFLGGAIYSYATSVTLGGSVWTGKLNASTSTNCYYAQYCPNDTTASCPPNQIPFILEVPEFVACDPYAEVYTLYSIGTQNGTKHCLSIGFSEGSKTAADCK